MNAFKTCLSLAAAFGISATVAAAAAPPMVVESARAIPVVYDVDVVVVGGSTGGVSAAVEAAKSGATVFLAAPRSYLGEDVCATMRLWLERGEAPALPLAKALFAGPAAPRAALPSVPFSYEADKPSRPPHTDPGEKVLADGAFGNPRTDSVQYDDDVTLTVDLGRTRRLRKVHLVAYRRAGDFDVASVAVRTSPDGARWQEAAVFEPLGPVAERDAPVVLSAAVTGEARYLQFFVRRAEGCKRVLLGEIAIEADGTTEPEAAVPEPPTPMHVKRVLDQALLDAGVRFLYGCYPTDVLRDAAGEPAGIVMANRSGRQAVLAKVIVDATERATLARIAGAEFAPYAKGAHEFRRVVVGGQAVEGDGLKVRRLPFQFASGKGRYDVFQYTLSIPMADDSFASFAEAEQQARDRTWHPKMVDGSERLFQVPPDPVKGTGRGDLGPFRPAGVARMYIVGGCADVARDEAAKLLRPLALMDLGAKIGAAAAAEAKALPAVRNAKVPGAKVTPVAAGDVKEFLVGVRPTQQGLPTVPGEARGVPVLGRYDVVVIGGGTGGAPAAIAASRQGVRTLVIEYQYALGGVQTLGLIGKYYHGNRVGFTKEIDAGVRGLGAAVGVVGKAEWYRREIRRAGGDVWFGAMGVGALVHDGTVQGVVVATPEDRGVVLAKTVIDATGNADIAAAAGAETEFVGAEHIAVQGTGLPPVALGASYTNTDYTFVDDADMLDLWRVMLLARKKFSGAFDLSSLVDSRERRRIVGDVVISPLDIINERTFPDVVCVTRSDFDSHGYTVHPVFLLRPPARDGRDLFCNLPYRAMLPKGLDGLLVIGLGTSAHRDAVPIIRMQPDIQNQGYAAGVAGAMAAASDSTVRRVDVRALQAHLVEVGNLPPIALSAEDSYPLSREKVAEAVRNASEGYRTMAVILAQPEQSVPLMREAYAKAASEEDRLAYAHILGMMGDPTGAETLLEKVRASAWDKGWNFRGMGQYGGSLSALDSYIIALGRTRDPRAVPVILDKVNALDERSEFSHCRAVAMALETLADPAAARPLAELLSKPGMAGYAVTVYKSPSDVPVADDRNRSLREIVLARALYRCGDYQGVGKKILETYAKDPRGIYARHAQAVLAGESK